VAADAGIFGKQKNKERKTGQKNKFRDQKKNIKFKNRGLDLFSFFARVISLSILSLP